MGYFPIRYDSRVVIYERKMFIRLATGELALGGLYTAHELQQFSVLKTFLNYKYLVS